MEVQVEVQAVLSLTQQRLGEMTARAIMLEALVNQQQEQLTQLQQTVDEMGKEMTNGHEADRRQKTQR